MAEAIVITRNNISGTHRKDSTEDQLFDPTENFSTTNAAINETNPSPLGNFFQDVASTDIFPTINNVLNLLNEEHIVANSNKIDYERATSGMEQLTTTTTKQARLNEVVSEEETIKTDKEPLTQISQNGSTEESLNKSVPSKNSSEIFKVDPKEGVLGFVEEKPNVITNINSTTTASTSHHNESSSVLKEMSFSKEMDVIETSKLDCSNTTIRANFENTTNVDFKTTMVNLVHDIRNLLKEELRNINVSLIRQRRYFASIMFMIHRRLRLNQKLCVRCDSKKQVENTAPAEEVKVYNQSSQSPSTMWIGEVKVNSTLDALTLKNKQISKLTPSNHLNNQSETIGHDSEESSEMNLIVTTGATLNQTTLSKDTTPISTSAAQEIVIIN